MEEFNPIILSTNVVKVLKFYTGMTIKNTLLSKKMLLGVFIGCFGQISAYLDKPFCLLNVLFS